LPGNLVDVVFGPKMFGVVSGVLTFIETPLIEQGEGVMIARMPGEETGPRGLGDKKAEQVEVEMLAGLQIGCIETEVAKAPDFEWAVQGDSAHVVLFRQGYRHGSFLLLTTLT
jgi:hypothetical protein